MVVRQAQAGTAGSTKLAARKGPLSGRTVVVVGAGGAGRALAFGAADRGAQVLSHGARQLYWGGQISGSATGCLASGGVQLLMITACFAQVVTRSSLIQ